MNNQNPAIIKPRREIKSFVRREGRLTTAQASALAELSDIYIISLANHAILDLEKLFGNQNPVVLEIGFGMGWSLLQQAKAQPEINFLGVEVHRPGVGALLAGMKKDHITNIRIINDDAVTLLRNHLADHCLTGIQIFFPDPWHKKRHHKRRLIQPTLVEILCHKLKPQGFLHCATDWQNYAEHILNVLNQQSKLKNFAKDNQYIERPASRPLTKFEQRGIRLGHGVWDLYFIKKG